MKKVLAIEEFAMMLAAIYLMTTLHLGISFWLYIPLFLSPDISMLGYLVNTKVGAISYNIFHHKAVAIAVVFLGLYLSNSYVLLAGYLLFGHSSFDRAMGFGLKYFDDFKHTHLSPSAPEGGLIHGDGETKVPL